MPSGRVWAGAEACTAKSRIEVVELGYQPQAIQSCQTGQYDVGILACLYFFIFFEVGIWYLGRGWSSYKSIRLLDLFFGFQASILGHSELEVFGGEAWSGHDILCLCLCLAGCK